MLAAKPYGFDEPFTGSTGWVKRYGPEPLSQFRSAQRIAEKWNISREEMEKFALESHRRALHAIDNGYFKTQIAPLGFRMRRASASQSRVKRS